MTVQDILDAIDESRAWDDLTREQKIGAAACAYAREHGWIKPTGVIGTDACRTLGLETRINKLEAALREIVSVSTQVTKEPRSVVMRRLAEAVLR